MNNIVFIFFFNWFIFVNIVVLYIRNVFNPPILNVQELSREHMRSKFSAV